MSNLFHAADPTFQFCMQTLVSVLFVKADEATQTLAWRVPALGEVFRYATGPAFLVGALVFAVAMYGVRGVTRTLTSGERLAANWYLWNTVVIHVMMDGLCGAHGWMGPMNDNYRILDRRYRPELVGQLEKGGTHATDRASAYTLNEMELFGHSVLTCFAFWGVMHKSPWRHTVEAIALTTQAVGAIIFVMPDMLTGCENMQPVGVKTCLPPVTPFFVFFFYFGVIINWLWVVVPVFMLVKVVQSDIAEKAALANKSD
jgi:hypothetical protein